ncbi:hypothetical protein XH88_15825 [Bradyrhizobium sp. CCBAU 51627]|nr:hypothetical protein [Bradyrhizobium sp. CCBAU 51627]
MRDTDPVPGLDRAGRGTRFLSLEVPGLRLLFRGDRGLRRARRRASAARSLRRRSGGCGHRRRAPTAPASPACAHPKCRGRHPRRR